MFANIGGRSNFLVLKQKVPCFKLQLKTHRRIALRPGVGQSLFRLALWLLNNRNIGKITRLAMHPATAEEMVMKHEKA